MKITHFGHACLLVETNGSRLLFDPGTISQGFESLTDLTAVLITHNHPDHLDLERLAPLLAANPGAQLISDTESAEQLGELGVKAVSAGDALTLGTTSVRVIGGAHAFVYEQFPQCANAAYLIDDGAFLHPGDSFVEPDVEVDILALATSGPWIKVGDAIGYERRIAPRVAIAMHEGELTSTVVAFEMIAGFAPDATTFTVLEKGVATEV